MAGLSKTFPGLRALDGVDFAVSAGEIVALVGQNGSGKSTLVKILTGVHEPDPGARIEGRAPEVDGSIHVIHQDLGLIGRLNTVENLDLGRRLGAAAALPARRRQEAEHARELLRRFGVMFDVTAPVAQLTPAERAIVAIARALDGWEDPRGLLILDEPTAALHSEEAGRLFTAVRAAAARGAGVIFVSHRLDEVLDLADRVVVLRDGRLVADTPVAHLDHDRLVRLIVGSALEQVAPRDNRGTGDLALQVRRLAGGTVRELDLGVRAGEVVGVSGIIGSGREHLAPLLFGALPRTGGDVAVGGGALPAADPGAAIRAGVAYVPADRHADGAVMTMRVRENLTLPDLRRLRRRGGRIDLAAERREAGEWLRRVELRPADPERPLELFSGGNQRHARHELDPAGADRLDLERPADPQPPVVLPEDRDGRAARPRLPGVDHARGRPRGLVRGAADAHGPPAVRHRRQPQRRAAGGRAHRARDRAVAGQLRRDRGARRRADELQARGRRSRPSDPATCCRPTRPPSWAPPSSTAAVTTSGAASSPSSSWRSGSRASSWPARRSGSPTSSTASRCCSPSPCRSTSAPRVVARAVARILRRSECPVMSSRPTIALMRRKRRSQ